MSTSISRTIFDLKVCKTILSCSHTGVTELYFLRVSFTVQDEPMLRDLALLCCSVMADKGCYSAHPECLFFPLLLRDRSATVPTHHIQAQPHHSCSSLLSRHHPTGASQGTPPFLWSLLSCPQFPCYFSSDFNLPLAKQKQWWENTI